MKRKHVINTQQIISVTKGKNTTITGSEEGDIINSGSGNSIIYGLGGNDIINGGSGNDKIYGGDGDDIINGAAGNDTLYGSNGRDIINGGSGKDTLYGGAGDDILNGDAGDDILFGDEGNDILNGGSGKDTLYGGAGDDILAGGTGNDILYGGAGNDTYMFNRYDGQDILRGDYGSNLETNTLRFGEKITADQITVKRSGQYDLLLTLNGTTDSILVEKFFSSNGPNGSYNPLQAVEFDDGTKWDLNELVSRITTGNASPTSFSASENVASISLIRQQICQFMAAGDDAEPILMAQNDQPAPVLAGVQKSSFGL